MLPWTSDARGRCVPELRRPWMSNAVSGSRLMRKRPRGGQDDPPRLPPGPRDYRWPIAMGTMEALLTEFPFWRC